MFVFVCVRGCNAAEEKNPDVFAVAQTICMLPLFTGTLQGLSSCAALGSLRSDSDRADTCHVLCRPGDGRRD